MTFTEEYGIMSAVVSLQWGAQNANVHQRDADPATGAGTDRLRRADRGGYRRTVPHGGGRQAHGPYAASHPVLRRSWTAHGTVADRGRLSSVLRGRRGPAPADQGAANPAGVLTRGDQGEPARRCGPCGAARGVRPGDRPEYAGGGAGSGRAPRQVADRHHRRARRPVDAAAYRVRGTTRAPAHPADADPQR